MLLRTPQGASQVILTEFCKMLTGKAADGRHVSQSRKSVSVRSGSTRGMYRGIYIGVYIGIYIVWYV